MTEKPIYISLNDSLLIRNRLPALTADKRLREASAHLLAELERAVIISNVALPANVVAIDSTVEVVDLGTGESDCYTLALPESADAAFGRISVLSPLGTALLGYAEGDEVSWQMPGGPGRFRINAVTQSTVPARSQGDRHQESTQPIQSHP